MSDFSWYHYKPSLALGAIAVALFALSGLLHLYQMIRTRTWFLIPFVVGCFFEAAGYAARIVSWSETPDYTLGSFITQSTLILVAPSLLAASIYMELGRVSELVDAESYLLVRRRWVTRVFVLGDILSFLTQGGGGGLLGSDSKSSQDLGSKVVLVGLGIQVAFFGCFVIVALLFHGRLHRRPTQRMLTEQLPYKRHLLTLYTTSILIFIRSIVRIVEFVQGFDGYIISHEAFLYVFDALPMLMAVFIMNWVHPSEVKKLLRREKAEPAGFQMLNQSESPDRLTV